ncbi:hypothetical protein [Microbacterium sp. C7(2022)]|uniref:hypothetical protein n=1 Tax=Microbacterium sp. C7(2022) TaxID=2992759 RepID=UPI00237ADDC0|nr:hypothetical protein [Microbacterium sp. C7(2022)]MDE0546564.1 hypothetical protein [Microbacterium sp. C7(2022)]
MDTATQDELRELRARAYGPDADIDRDPAALRRLRELEAVHGAALTNGASANGPAGNDSGVNGSAVNGSAVNGSGVSVAGAGAASAPSGSAGPSARVLPPVASDRAASAPTTSPAAPTPAAGPTNADLIAMFPEAADRQVDPGAAAQPVTPAAPAAEGAGRRTRGRKLPLRIKVWWALSVVGAVILTAAATWGINAMAPVQTSSGAPQIATLEPVTDVVIPDGWFGMGASSNIYQYYGLTLFESIGGFGVDGTRCFTAIATDDLPEDDAEANNWSINGMAYSGCSVGSFPAIIQLPIDVSMPRELTDEFPDGGALQFIMDGDRVGVFYDSE